MSENDENIALGKLRAIVTTAIGQRPQSEVASKAQIDRAELNHLVNGTRRLPPASWVLAQLADELELDLVELLLLRECAHAQHSAQQSKGTPKHVACLEIAHKVDRFLYDYRHNRPGRVTRVKDDCLSLRDWPDGFDIQAVVVGDRRELPPHSWADVLALPASTGDLMYVADLGLPRGVTVRSDKVVKVANEESLKSLFSSDILIVGSGAANLATRIVNDSACFQFIVPDNLRSLTESFETDLSSMKFDRKKLKTFLEPKAFEDNKRLSELKNMRHWWAQRGFYDPVDYSGPRGEHRTAHNDFGIVTLCQNPWSEQHVAILAAGCGGPATAAALKLLATEGAFEDHPLGGVFMVDISTEAPWEERYEGLDPEWDSHPYKTIEKYEQYLTLEQSEDRPGVRLETIGSLIRLLRTRSSHPLQR